MKEKIDDLIHKILEKEDYSSEKYIEGLHVVSFPLMVMCQIVFFFYANSYLVPEEGFNSFTSIILESIWFGFGGVLIYLIIVALLTIFSAFIKEKPVGLTIIVLGIIGTVLSFWWLS